MARLRAALTVLAVAGAASCAEPRTPSVGPGGAPAAASVPAPTPAVTDEMIDGLLSSVLDTMPELTCGEAACAPATAEERANPPVSRDEARAVIARGFVSGFGERCGLDWREQNFHPMMAYWRHQQRKRPRQMAMIGMLHGFAQGQAGAYLEACDARTRQAVALGLRFRPEKR